MKTKVLKRSEIKRNWYLVDAQGKVLGRIASRIARLLTGKDKPQYSPHVDCGDYVIVLNADKFTVTGNKMEEKIYYRHSFYPGGLKAINLKLMLEKSPEKVLYHAVSGMLPKNKFRARRLKRLKLYLGNEHPHQAQLPKIIRI
ncbi:MAG: 50S ribosomal protein L13 [candidate division WOR-3 bacterium]|nr:50S ribosomal protein L13 [candidate division WOR-3 bacterium]